MVFFTMLPIICLIMCVINAISGHLLIIWLQCDMSQAISTSVVMFRYKTVPDSMSQLACSWLLVQNKHIMGKNCHYLISGGHVIVLLIIANPLQGSLDIWQKMVPCITWSQLACSQSFVQIIYFTHTKDGHLLII